MGVHQPVRSCPPSDNNNNNNNTNRLKTLDTPTYCAAAPHKVEDRWKDP